MNCKRGVLAGVALLSLGVTGCGGEAEPPVAAPVSSPPTTAAAPDSAGAPEPAAPSSWVMPDLVGENLQDAQDAIQTLTDYGIALTTSTDATGAGRLQVLDRSWQVCAQNVAASDTITPTTVIDFAAVKLDESC